MGTIVAIGGGSLQTGETGAIDRQILRRTGRRKPRALFIPTASSDDLEYRRNFRRAYGRRLGCRTDELLLLGRTPPPKEIARKIREADLIYVGGGNTLKMMRRWRHLGVDRHLRRAHRRGTVLCGLSAGCLCWFDWGHSDSMAFYHPRDWDYIRVRGLGLIPGTGCPHYDAEKRDADFEAMIARVGGVGIAIDNCAALEVSGARWRVLTSRRGAGVYRVTRRRGRIETERLLLP